MNSQWTPGPWEWVGRDLESKHPDHSTPVIETEVGCGSFCYGGTVDFTISEADAKLIAAAPELVEALYKARRYVGMVTEIPGDDPIFAVMDEIDAALSKAGAVLT